MFLLLNPSNFHIQNIHFLEKKMNMIMEGFFTKIGFSTTFMTMNCVFFKLPFSSPHSSNHFLTISQSSHKDIIQRLCSIEKHLIQYYMMFYNSNKTPVYSLKTQLQRGQVKYYKDVEPGSTESAFYLKISGIWENSYEVGITFKLIEYCPGFIPLKNS
jgi:hypothetical protein